MNRSQNRLLPIALALAALAGSGGVAAAQPSPWPQDSAWVPLQKNGATIGDPTTDGQTQGRNLVGDATRPSAYYYRDASYFYLRVRVDESPLNNTGGLNPYAWACGIDINPKTQQPNIYEFLVMLDNKNSIQQVQYQYNSTPNSQPNPVQEVAETVVQAYPSSTYSRTEVVASTVGNTTGFSGNPDYFIDWAIPISVMTSPPSPVGGFTIPPVDFSQPIAFFCGSSSSGNSLNADRADNGSGTTDLGTVLSDPIVCTGTSCANGCLQNSDCTQAGATYCNTTSNRCVQCLTDANCGLTGTTCSASGSCVLPAPAVVTPTNGSTLVTQPTVTGNTLAGTQVTVTIVDANNPSVIVDQGAATVSAAGTWTYSPAITLGSGSYTVSATANATLAGASTTSPPSNANTFTIQVACGGAITCASTPSTPVCDNGVCVQCASTPDCPAGATCSANACVLAAPVITSPTDGSTLNTPSPTILGTTAVGTTVTVTIRDNGGNVVDTGTATVDGSGNWSYTPPMNLTPGSYSITAVASSTQGGVTATSQPSAPVGITIVNGCLSAADCTNAAAPVCDLATNSCVRCLAPSDCPATTPAMACTANACVLAQPTITAPTDGSTLNDTTPSFTGTAADGTTVTLTVDGVVLASGIPVVGGTWSYTPSTPLATGGHSATATATAGSGPGAVSSDSTPVGFTIVSGCLSVNDCSGATPVCDLSDNTCVRCLSANDCPATTPAMACTARACVLAAPTVTMPTANSTSNDLTPTFTGTAPDGTTVTLTMDGTVIASGIPVSNGTWTYTPSSDLTAGDHNVVATATVGSGPTAVSASSASTPFRLVMGCLSSSDCSGATPACDVANGVCVACVSNSDCPGAATCANQTCVLAAPVIAFPAAGMTTSETRPTITGTAPAGSTVTISIDGVVVGSTTADANGMFALTPTDPLAPGPHNVSATASVTEGGRTVTSPTSMQGFTVQAIPVDDFGTPDLGGVDAATPDGMVAPDMAASESLRLIGGGVGCDVGARHGAGDASAALLLLAGLAWHLLRRRTTAGR